MSAHLPALGVLYRPDRLPEDLPGAGTVILDPLPPAFDEQLARFSANVMPAL